MEFEMPLSMASKNVVGLSFPLTYPSSKNSEILTCDDLNFICQFKLFPLKINSISSNPAGKLDLTTSTYSIDHLDQNLSSISIIFDPNVPEINSTSDIDQVQSPENIVTIDNNAIFQLKIWYCYFCTRKSFK